MRLASSGCGAARHSFVVACGAMEKRGRSARCDEELPHRGTESRHASMQDLIPSPATPPRAKGQSGCLDGAEPHTDLSDSPHATVEVKDWRCTMPYEQSDVPDLVKRLKDRDRDVRLDAAICLGDLGDRRAVEPLIARLKDKDNDVRANALQSISRLVEPGDSVPLEPLIAALKDKYWWARARAANVLGQLEDRRAVEPRIKRLKREKEQTVRADIENALLFIGGPEAEEALAEHRSKQKRD